MVYWGGAWKNGEGELEGGGDCGSVFGALAKFGSLRGAYGASARCNFNIYVRIVRIDEVATCNVPLAAYSMAWGAASAPLPLSICLPVRLSVCLASWRFYGQVSQAPQAQEIRAAEAWHSYREC